MIGRFIQKQREMQNLSQEYVAKKLDVSRPTYIAIEQGKRDPTSSEIKKLAALFHITPSELLEEEISHDIEVVVTSKKGKQKEIAPLRINVPQKNLDKFREVLLYILVKVGAKPNIGETVLYKLLYFIDFDYYEKFEEQLIGATYIKNHFGPTPVEFKMLVEDMVESEELEVIKSKYFQHNQKKYQAVRNPDLSKLLTAQEIKHIDEVLARLSDKNASELSNYSHQDVPWVVAEEGKPIEYESVFYRTPKTSVRNYESDTI
ncbi:MAG: DUF4065 domain-containing protein [Candidatus Dojkabacteria bacterium]|nr:MAG: DUF4065 domain-containing protein [Candidatus Dojkabacteria bacterium]